MLLTPVAEDQLPLVYGWLTAPDVAKWLDFGDRGALESVVQLQFLLRRRSNRVRLFAPSPTAKPAGVVGFSNIHLTFRSAMLWYALGEPSLSGRGLTTGAVARLLAEGFDELGLETVHAWAVAKNVGSIRVLQRNGFRPIGRQRRCHLIDGRLADRLLFDLVREEFAGLKPDSA